MADQIRVNIKHRVANAAIKREKRNGRDTMVIPSAVAKFNTTLNGIFYPQEELEASYQGLNGTLAPLGHPVIGNTYVSARTPDAINQFHIGAHNENARIEGDRIIADMVLDVEYAKRHPEGQRLLDAINGGKPISTSTGLLMQREDAPEGSEYQYVGRNYAWDHVAALLDEAPAIGTNEGIGLMVNSAGEREQIEVVNSELVLNDALPNSMEDMRERLQTAAVDKYGPGYVSDFNEGSLIFFDDSQGESYRIGYGSMDGELTLSDERQRVQRQVTWEAVSNAVRSTLSKMFGTAPGAPKAQGLSVNTSQEIDMTPEELKAALAEQATNMQAAFNTAVTTAVNEAVAPLQEQITALNSEREATAKAEKSDLVAKVVAANAATQEEAEAMDVNALRIVERNCAKAPGLAGGLFSNRADNAPQDTLPE